MAEKTQEDILRNLREAIESKPIVPLFGAGTSASSAGIPSASFLIDFLEKMRRESEVFSTSAGEWQKHVSAFEPPAKHEPGETEQNRDVELEQECGQLRLENQLLQSRVAELRRTASREVQRFDQLLIEHSELQSQNGNLLNCLRGRVEATDTITALLLKQQFAQLKLMERYEGVVEHVHGDNVTVVFEVDDDVIEHKYDRNQFIDGQLPEQGDHLTVFVHVVHGSVENQNEPAVETDELDEHDDEGCRITGPIEF